MLQLRLPSPPSVNHLFANAAPKREEFPLPGTKKQRGRRVTARYRTWRKEANACLWGVKLKHFVGPVEIHLAVADKGQGDLDNKLKAILDFLVHHTIIEDDNRQFVRKVILEWANIEGCIVTITQKEALSCRANG